MAPSELLRSPNRKKVGMDIDGTLALFHDAFIAEYNAAHGTHHTIEVFSSYNKWDIPVSSPEFLAKYNEMWTQRWASIRPSVSQSTLNLLVEAHDVDILTHRLPEHEPYLRCWLGLYFPYVQAQLNIRITNSSEAKVLTKYDILFDDAPPVAEELIRTGAGKRLFLIEQPWNRNERYEQRGPGITRVKTLKEGIELLVRTGHGTGNPKQSKSRIAR